MSVKSISDAELIRRAISNAAISPRAATSRVVPLWRKVSDIFSLGSTYSAELCRIHDFNPDEQVRP